MKFGKLEIEENVLWLMAFISTMWFIVFVALAAKFMDIFLVPCGH